MTVADLMKLLSVMPGDTDVYTVLLNVDGGAQADRYLIPLVQIEFNVSQKSVNLG